MARFKEQKNVPIERLKPAKHNPPNRTTKEACRGMMAAMETLGGTLYPIVVDNDYNIIDGHRRYFAARYLQWKTVDVMVLESSSNGAAGAEDKNLIYAVVNDSARRQSANDKMFVYLKEANALNPYMRGRIQRAVDELGIDLFKRLQKEGYSLEPYRTARRVAWYCGMEGKERTIVLWILAHTDMMKASQAAIAANVAPATIQKAIEGNRRLKLAYA